MNRRFVRSLLLAALLVLLCTQVFAAQETLAVLRLDPESGFTTRMEDTDGNTLTPERRSGIRTACEFRPLCKNRLLFDLL